MNLPKFLRPLSRVVLAGQQAGFTMIELLVVISVIGVLAVAVLSSINPIEQVNKGRDTRTRSDAAQMINAIDRYFAIHEVYPWNRDANWAPNTTPDLAFDSPDSDGSGNGYAWVQFLADTAEVKQGFVDRVIAAPPDGQLHYFYKGAGYNETIYACFSPRSAAFGQEAADNCASGATPNVGAGDVLCANDRTGTPVPNQYICLP